MVAEREEVQLTEKKEDLQNKTQGNRNEVEIVFDAISCNESFARVAVAAFITHLNPTLEELSEEAQLGREAIILAMEAGAEVESLNSSLGQEDGSELCLVDRVVAATHGCVGASIGSSGAVENDVEKDRLLDRMLLAQLLGELPERDRELIRMRYFQNKTQTEIAGILGISQVQVSRLEKKILREMREMAG